MVKPSKRQLEFMDWEFGIFFHFGIRTFYEGHKDWDNEPMDINVFNPCKLDCSQWVRAAADAGAKYAVFTAKHHDGFANWNSKYTDYSVANTSWRGGSGDIVKEFTDACRQNGLHIGIYYSPAEFGSRERDNYDDYFINQISELLTNYGKIDYLWFDGCGSEGHEYNKDRIIFEIRRMQPEILIFNMWDPDTRWIGNEDGYAPETNINETDSLDVSVLTDNKDKLETKKFLPAECDCRIRDNWFFCETDKNTLKSVEKLIDMYECSIGRGANLLLNIGPDRNGLIQDSDFKRLLEFGNRIKMLYANPSVIFRGNEVILETPVYTDRIVLKENMENGQKVRSFTISAEYKGEEKIIFQGTTIGHKRICKFSPVTANKIKVTLNNGMLQESNIYQCNTD